MVDPEFWIVGIQREQHKLWSWMGYGTQSSTPSSLNVIAIRAHYIPQLDVCHIAQNWKPKFHVLFTRQYVVTHNFKSRTSVLWNHRHTPANRRIKNLKRKTYELQISSTNCFQKLSHYIESHIKFFFKKQMNFSSKFHNNCHIFQHQEMETELLKKNVYKIKPYTAVSQKKKHLSIVKRDKNNYKKKSHQ